MKNDFQRKFAENIFGQSRAIRGRSCDNWLVEYWHKVWELYASRLNGSRFAPWAHLVLPKAHYSAQTGILFWNIFRIASTTFHYLCTANISPVKNTLFTCVLKSHVLPLYFLHRNKCKFYIRLNAFFYTGTNAIFTQNKCNFYT